MKRVLLTDRFKHHLDPEFFAEFADVELITAYSNEDALKIHRSQRADVIITELYGSGMSTQQFCEDLRQDEGLRGVSIIVVCRDNAVELAEAGRCRANAVQTLPVSRSDLRRTLRRFLDVPPRRDYQGNFSARRIGSPADIIDCRAENISIGGMLIRAKAELRKGDRLSCTFTLPPQQPFITQAEVVRTVTTNMPTESRQYGIRFSNLPATARRAIERIVHPS